ncbi:MAG: hypothetical protein KDC67_08730, partial [Ignavibacteriae bacterium]|nr:hypothetical protein [Ignavibacteriota bacterium]
MKKILLLFTLFILFGCSEDDSNSDNNQQEVFGTKDITVSLVLPENSNINPDDLTITTIFTDNGQINNGTGNIEIFDNDAIELIYAKNNNNNIVLMSYLNPSNTNTIELNSITTAQALAMLHPWTMHLSVQAREEALQEIISSPEFESYHNQIISSINSGEVDPLISQDVINSLGEFQTAFLNRVETEIPPLKMVAENNLATFTNTKSSFAYDLQLFDGNGDTLGESITLEGQNKNVGVFSTLFGFISGNNLFQDTNIGLTIPNNNQEYQVVAKTWSGNAKWINGANLLGDSFSIISTTVGGLIKSTQCAFDLGSFVIDNNVNLINLISNNEISASQATSLLLQFIQQNSNTILQIIVDCRGGFAGSNLSQFASAFSYVGNIEGAINAAFRFTDWILYDSEIQFCFERTQNEIVECQEQVNFIEIENTGQILEFNIFNVSSNIFSVPSCNGFEFEYVFNPSNTSENLFLLITDSESQLVDGTYSIGGSSCITGIEFTHPNINSSNTEDNDFINGTITVSDNAS